MLEYLFNVLLTWLGYFSTAFLVIVLFAASLYMFSSVAAKSGNKDILDMIEKSRELFLVNTVGNLVKVLLFFAATLLVLSMVLPSVTPKTNLRTEPTTQQVQQRLDSLSERSKAELRQIESPGSNPDRQLRQQCREAKQGLREMDMNRCKDIDL